MHPSPNHHHEEGVTPLYSLQVHFSVLQMFIQHLQKTTEPGRQDMAARAARRVAPPLGGPAASAAE